MKHLMYKRGEYWVATSEEQRDAEIAKGAKCHGFGNDREIEVIKMERLMAGRGRPRKVRT